MQIFYFVFNVVPNNNNPLALELEKGIAHVMVIEKEENKARTKALAKIELDQWLFLNEELSFEMPVEQFPKSEVEPVDLILYEKALKFGVASDYISCPKKDASVLQ